MKLSMRMAALALLLIGGSGTFALAADIQKDAKALDVLNKMTDYTSSIDQVMIKAEVFGDASMDGGLVVSSPAEVRMWIDRPGSMYLEKFDGVYTAKIYIHEGNLTVYGSEDNFYARAKVPEKIQDAMQYAMEKFELETPLAEFLFADSVMELMSDQDQVLYLTDKSRISGVDCHHIAVRGKVIDLQLWIQEGDQPAPRKMSMTMKWEGGSPRNVTFLEWVHIEKHDPGIFEFKPPEGAQEIRFVGSDNAQ